MYEELELKHFDISGDFEEELQDEAADAENAEEQSSGQDVKY